MKLKLQYSTIFYRIGLLILVLGIPFSAQAQLSEFEDASIPYSPTVAGQVRYGEIPVTPYTGVPNVSIPLIAMPTRVKELSINLGLSYHPGSAAANEGAGQNGVGWSLASGGVIYRTIPLLPDEYTFKKYPNIPTGSPADMTTRANNLYQYNVMGYSGSFIVELSRDGNNTLSVEIIENKSGGVVKIDMDYTQATAKVNSFTLYNDRGFKFRFSVYDEITRSFSLGTARLNASHRPTFYLEEILDNNDKPLVKYTFTTELKPGVSLEPDSYKKVETIVVPGKAKIGFVYGTSLLTSMTLSDAKNNPVKKFSFSYGNNFGGKSVLAKIEESNFQNSKKLIHQMYYKNTLGGYNYTADMYGFYKRVIACTVPGLYSDADPTVVTMGTLEKISYPTGGSTIFDFESHTFSQKDGPIPDADYQQMEHNYTNPLFASHNFGYDSHTIWEFTVTGGPRTFYFKVSIPPQYIDDFGNPVSKPIYARVRLMGAAGELANLTENNNGANSCKGVKIVLQPGTYSIMKSQGFRNNNESVSITEHVLSGTIKKWAYGGGVRIKRIGHFSENVPQTYYTDPYITSQFTPVRETSYDYNFFGDPTRSSGAIAYRGFALHTAGNRVTHEQVGYKNVTVTQTGNNGKVQYSYLSPMDFTILQLGNLVHQNYFDYKRGLCYNQKTFNAGGQLLSEVVTGYEFTDYQDQVGPTTIYGRNGWIKQQQITSKSYLYQGATPQVVETNQTLVFNDVNRRIQKQTMTTAYSGESLVTDYEYHPLAMNRNRITEIAATQTYRNGALVARNAIVYANNWNGNSVYLPQKIQTAKGPLPELKTQKVISSYDSYSNPIEFSAENGAKTTYIWGYSGSAVIAVIENASYAQVSSYVANLQTLSENGTELQLRNALNAMRNALATSVPNAVVTTYTHIPVAGMASVTDAKGQVMTYEYDEFLKLKLVRDHQGYILSENQYNTKTTN